MTRVLSAPIDVGNLYGEVVIEYPGQSGHLHLSLIDADGQNIFYDAKDPAGISQKMRQAVAGLQRYLPEFLSMLAPTVNSYTRLVKGAWAPTAATWGIENRTAAIRVIPGDLHSQRIEVRVGGADANPYLVQAAARSYEYWHARTALPQRTRCR